MAWPWGYPPQASLTGLPEGLYTFALSGWGGRVINSGSGSASGGSGGMVVLTKRVRPSDTITVAASHTTTPGEVQISFPDGTVATAGNGGDGDNQNGALGIAKGGDVNLVGGGSSNGLNSTGFGTGPGSTTQGGCASLFIFKVA